MTLSLERRLAELLDWNVSPGAKTAKSITDATKWLFPPINDGGTSDLSWHVRHVGSSVSRFFFQWKENVVAQSAEVKRL